MLDSARFQFTLKMRLNRIWPKDPTYAIFLKSQCFNDHVKLKGGECFAPGLLLAQKRRSFQLECKLASPGWFLSKEKNHNKSTSSVFESSIPSHRSLSPFMNIFAVFAFPNQMKNFTPINHLDDTWTDIGGQIKDRAQKWINCRKEINVLVLKIKDDVYF